MESIKGEVERELSKLIGNYKREESVCKWREYRDKYDDYCVCLNEQKRVREQRILRDAYKTNEYEKVDEDFDQCYRQEWQAIENEGKEFFINIFATFVQEIGEAK